MQTNHTHLQSQRKIPKIYYSDILTKLSSLSHQKSEVENIMGVKIIITYIMTCAILNTAVSDLTLVLGTRLR